MKMDIVDIISNNKLYNKGNKLIKLYAVVMLNYRQELGDKAWEQIDLLFNDKSLTTAFSFLLGFTTGESSLTPDTEKLKKFIASDLKELEKIR
jgi:hypothetical protein